MIKFITILIGCSLTLAAGVRAEQENPKNKPAQKSKPVQKQQFAPKQHPVANNRVQNVQHQHKAPAIQSNVRVHNNNVSKQQLHTLPAVQSNKLHAVQSNKLHAVQSNKLPAVQSDKLRAVQPNKLPAVQANKQTMQRIQAQHQNFHATPKSSIASAQFNQNYQINGAQNWQGSNYQVFQSYRPQWHDQGYWRSNYNNLSLIGGGWYYWDGGYWYPAWGYDEAAAYYPYDGPIYSGPSARPFDQVVADVQSALQQQGYYHGEVDGLLGPQTRQALAEYQRAQGLYTTETIDQPTLQSLGMG
jgi:hypothetical protein